MRIHSRAPTPICLAIALLVLAGCAGPRDALLSGDAGACRAETEAGAVVVGSGAPGDPAAPEPASGYRLGRKAVHARSYLVVTAHPLASRAGCRMLAAGGSAIDAAIAAQAVLGLVEPQSSGLGGGAFLLHHDAKTKAIAAYDGRETAPAAATGDYLRWIDDADRSAPKPNARASGRSIGTPGLVRLLEAAHQRHGRLQWRELFRPATTLALEGFPIGGRLAAAIAASRSDLVRDADAAAYFLDAAGEPRPLGSVLRNPAYAATLASIGDGGADAFYRGRIAQAIVDKINATTAAHDGSPMTPGKTTLEDLASYRPRGREPVCTTYRVYWVCGMPPPSSGGIAVASALGVLEHFDLAAYPPAPPRDEGGKPHVMAVHLVSEAERLAYADRDKYVADTDFVALPGGSWNSLLGTPYLKSRASLVRRDRSMGTAQPGDFGAVALAADRTPESGTSQITVVDRDGNAAVMTTTVESTLGAFRMAQGFVLNNQLTDFSAAPADASGQPIANRVEPGKRPRSSMAPTLVFARAPDGGRGDLMMATGSPGGGAIIQYVVKTLVGVLDWKLDAQQATSLVAFGAANTPTTTVGGEHPAIDATANGDRDPLVTGLRALGHTVSTAAQASGLGTIVRVPREGGAIWAGGADPRREGIALGDAVRP